MTWYTRATSDAAIFDIEQFNASVWFTRAWTLQELLAPADVRFFNSSFYYIGSHAHLRDYISRTNEIDKHLLNRRHTHNVTSEGTIFILRDASVAERMRWASKRKATREEDVAYSLLGIFEVNMPLLYGEGSRAFSRLQSEIVKTSSDSSIFAWRYNSSLELTGLLAPDITCFSDIGLIRRPYLGTARVLTRHPYEETNIGLRFPMWLSEIRLAECYKHKGSATVIIPLNCSVHERDIHTTELGAAAIKVQVVGYRAGPGPQSNLLLGRRASEDILLFQPSTITKFLPFIEPQSLESDNVEVDGSEREFLVYFPSDFELVGERHDT